jgi:hypothetical protein
MTIEHPITPPPELRREWRQEAPRARDCGIAREDWLMDRAAQWGADQELEACCDWLGGGGYAGTGSALRVARRPKPLSLKERAIKDLAEIGTHYICPGAADLIKTIRRALEALPND